MGPKKEHTYQKGRLVAVNWVKKSSSSSSSRRKQKTSLAVVSNRTSQASRLQGEACAEPASSTDLSAAPEPAFVLECPNAASTLRLRIPVQSELCVDQSEQYYFLEKSNCENLEFLFA